MKTTYEVIGAAYSEVEAKEPWCKGAVNVADIGLLSAEAVNGGDATARVDSAPDTGAARVLLEEQLLFDIIDAEMDFSAYKMLILPDSITVDDELKAKLDTFLADGGKLFMTGDSGLNPSKTDFVFDVGAEFDGPSQFEPDYIVPVDELRPEFIKNPLVMYNRANRIKVTEGTFAWADL